MSRKSFFIAAVGYVALSGAAMACPSFASVGNEAYDIAGTTGPTTFSVVAGGSNQAEFCGGIFPVNAPSAYGYFISPPDFSFFLAGAPGATVVVSTNSPNPSCDTVLLSNTPNTNWYFNDDANQLQSRIEMPNVAEGRLDVWVGTFDGTFCQTNLILEVVGGAAPAGGDGSKPEDSTVETAPAPAAEAAVEAEATTAADAEAPAEEPLVEAPAPGGGDAETTDETVAVDAAPAEAEAEAGAGGGDSAVSK
ncbi:MAG: hypothetical protein AAGA70_01075 [Pseudomonadota bacterium]